MEWYDEGHIEYDTAFAFLATWDYSDHRIVVRLVDTLCENVEAIKSCGIRVYRYQKVDEEDGGWIDVTAHLFRHEDGRELDMEIRPTLNNVREVMRIIDENEEATYSAWLEREVE